MIFEPQSTVEASNFSMGLMNLPLLHPNVITKSIEISFKNKTYTFEVDIDQTLLDIQRDFPPIAETAYLDVPLSSSLRNSLIRDLNTVLKDLSPEEQVQFLMNFTRNAFAYKTDEQAYQQNFPMIAEDVFFYPYSDCEDRVALFYQLNRETINLPLIVITYPNHMTVALHHKEFRGLSVDHKGDSYYFCDPTGPVNSLEIGWLPEKYKRLGFQVVGHYIPILK